MVSKMLLTVVVLTAVLPFRNSFSQIRADTVKIVAIYSSQKSFFKDYSIDSLVSHLNSLNANTKINFYKSTEDHSKTGFYADYLVDIDVWLQTPINTIPNSEVLRAVTPPAVAIRLPNGSTATNVQYVPSFEERSNSGNISPTKGEVLIQVIQKSKNEKVSRRTLLASNKEQNLEVILIIQLIQFLLSYFSG